MYLRGLKDETKQFFLDLALCIASSDGDYSEEEKFLINEYQKEMNFFKEPVRREIEEILVDFKTIEILEKRKVLFEIAGFCLIDGIYGEEEKELLERICDSFGIDKKELIEIISIVETFNIACEVSAEFISRK